MSTIEERAPLAPITDRRQLRVLLAEAEAVQARLMETLAEAVALLEPIIVLSSDDPLAAFRLPDGTVCYRTVPVAEVRPGQWFERQHGDEAWHQVERVVPGESMIGLVHDGGGGLMWWPRVDGRVRVACRPELLACRAESAELRAEARADRAEVAG